MPLWLTAWHLTALVALLLLWREKSKRREMLYGGVVSLPVLLLVPILSESYFGLFSPIYIWAFFLSQAVVVFSLGVIGAALYEKVLRSRVVKQAKPSRHHFLYFAVGLILSLIIFDVVGQPLLPSLVYGVGINALLAIRYYPEEIYDVIFSSLVMGLFYVFVYATILFDLPGETGRFWFTDSLSGLTIFGLAIEKIIAAFAFGLFWGPLYIGLKDVFSRKS